MTRANPHDDATCPPRRRARIPALVAAATLTVGTLLVPGAATAATSVTNAGFESGLDGWSTTGPAGAAKIEGGGYQSTNRLTHWLETDTTVITSQTLSGIPDGWHTFRADVKSGGPMNSSRLVLTGCGTDGSTVIPSTEAANGWLSMAVSAYVTDGDCTLRLSTSGAQAWASMDNVSFTPGKIDRMIRGADLSSIPKNEDHGASYAWDDGTPVDPVQAFADVGTNLVRLKVWVNPADGYNMKRQVVNMAQRAQAEGMRVLIDFHYSDTWADPGAQEIPSAWEDLGPAGLAKAVYDHTYDVMSALKAAGITPYAVQIGNETNPGMLLPYGQTWDANPDDAVEGAQWDNLAWFLKSGTQAVEDVSPSTKTILHLTNLDKGIDGLTWWLDQATSRNVPFDIIGLSYYGFWHGSLSNLQDAVTTLSERYDRDVLVVETSYPFTLEDNPNPSWPNVVGLSSQLVENYPATPTGQAAFFRAVQDVVASAPGGRGIGVIYWEPAWTAVPGSGWNPEDPSSGNGWENQAVFDYDNRALPAVHEFWPGPADTVNLW